MEMYGRTFSNKLVFMKAFKLFYDRFDLLLPKKYKCDIKINKNPLSLVRLG
jgi:hypothetical protein